MSAASLAVLGALAPVAMADSITISVTPAKVHVGEQVTLSATFSLSQEASISAYVLHLPNTCPASDSSLSVGGDVGMFSVATSQSVFEPPGKTTSAPNFANIVGNLIVCAYVDEPPGSTGPSAAMASAPLTVLPEAPNAKWTRPRCAREIYKYEGSHRHATKQQLVNLVNRFHRQHGCPKFKVHG